MSVLFNDVFGAFTKGYPTPEGKATSNSHRMRDLEQS
jgi:hypothetical protein